MPRAKRGNKRLQKRKDILKLARGYRGTKSKLYRHAKEQVERSLNFAFTGRKLKKREFRSLWIVRIGAAARASGASPPTRFFSAAIKPALRPRYLSRRAFNWSAPLTACRSAKNCWRSWLSFSSITPKTTNDE